MAKEKEAECDQAHAVAMRLFREETVTFSKSGASVSIQCKTADDANSLLTWLSSIDGKYGTVEDWLDEIETFSLRRERLDNPIVMEPWVRAAFNAGCSRESD